MNRLFRKIVVTFLLIFLLTNCSKDEDTRSTVTEYTVWIGLMGGYTKYLSVFNNGVFEDESSAAFVPLKDCKINELKIKVTKNDLNSDAQLIMRKNGTSTTMSIRIPQGQTGYFSNSDVVSLKATDEIDLFLDTSSSSGGEIDITIGIALE